MPEYQMWLSHNHWLDEHSQSPVSTLCGSTPLMLTTIKGQSVHHSYIFLCSRGLRFFCWGLEIVVVLFHVSMGWHSLRNLVYLVHPNQWFRCHWFCLAEGACWSLEEGGKFRHDVEAVWFSTEWKPASPPTYHAWGILNCHVISLDGHFVDMRWSTVGNIGVKHYRALLPGSVIYLCNPLHALLPVLRFIKKSTLDSVKREDWVHGWPTSCIAPSLHTLFCSELLCVWAISKVAYRI